MASRLASIFARLNVENYSEFDKILKRGDGVGEFIQAMTTNKTGFWREPAHFEFLESNLLAYYQKKSETTHGSNKLRIWCAASSTGQEIYTLLFILDEIFGAGLPNIVKVLATDIDCDALKSASKGVYYEKDLEDLPDHYKTENFRELASDRLGRRFAVKDKFRDLVTFAQLNLVEWPYDFSFGFDLIFCRNVLIYFDKVTVEKVILELSKTLILGGMLFIGHSEMGAKRPSSLETVISAGYKKIG